MKKGLFYGILAVLGLAAIGVLAQDYLQKYSQNLQPKFNVIVIGWDGVQRDHFWQCYNKELPECPDGLPHIKELSGGRIFNNVVTNGATDTKAGWSQILSGYNAEITGIYSNNSYRSLPRGHSVFEKLEKHFGENNIVTLFVASKRTNMEDGCLVKKRTRAMQGGKGKKKIVEEIVRIGYPWYLTKKSLDYFENGLGENQNVGKKALGLLEKYKNKRFFAFFHFKFPDRACHFLGENSVQYSLEIIDDDRWLGKIATKLKKLGIYEQTLIYVITDHGCNEDGKGGYEAHSNAPYGFLATNDPLVIRDGDRKDIAPTILKRYGISLKQKGDIPAVNGYPLDSIPAIGCIPEGEAYIDYPNLPKCCNGLRLIGLDKYFLRIGCIPPTGGRGDNTGYCTNCGDGKCKPPENKCNCAEDCK